MLLRSKLLPTAWRSVSHVVRVHGRRSISNSNSTTNSNKLTTNTTRSVSSSDKFTSRSMSNSNKFTTTLAQAGKFESPYGDLCPPIHLSTTFAQQDGGGYLGGHLYSRLRNPTRASLESTFAELETASGAFAFASGMAAVSSMLTACPGYHIVLPDDLYHGVYVVAQDIMKPWGMTNEQIDMSNLGQVELALDKAFENGQHKVVLWLETISNPSCKLSDFATISEMAKAKATRGQEVVVVVDATWSTPYLQQPLDKGADFVLHSLTKYVGGHSDMLGGLIAVGTSPQAQALTAKLRVVHEIGGAVLSPHDCYTAIRGLRSLAVRMDRHCSNAMALARYLDTHELVERCLYPGLSSHPQHELATKTMREGLYGGMLAVRVKAKSKSTPSDLVQEHAMDVVRHCKVLRPATSLGGTESYIEHRRSIEGDYPVSPPDLLRVSVGLEDVEDLKRDLDSALSLAWENA